MAVQVISKGLTFYIALPNHLCFIQVISDSHRKFPKKHSTKRVTYMSQHIMSVAKVDLAFLKSNPPCLVISASGFVTTPGWTNGKLQQRFYVKFPADGIQDFDFVADPPDGITSMVETKIAAKPIEWDSPPQVLKGVRVHAQSNKHEALLGKSNTFSL
jgi:hypothetical protein